jgi:hypothetical protein
MRLILLLGRLILSVSYFTTLSVCGLYIMAKWNDSGRHFEGSGRGLVEMLSSKLAGSA